MMKDMKDVEKEEDHVVTRPNQRRKLRTVAAYLMYLGMGLTSAVHGPTLVNMKELLDTDTVHLSLAMSMLSIGYLLGASVCGLLFHRFDSELQFSLASLLQGVSLIAAPWSRDVYGFMAACTLTGIGMAYIDTGGNAIVLMLWGGHRAKEPLLQGMHFIWSVGSTLSPFVLRPFLVNHAIDNTACLNKSASDSGGSLTTDGLRMSSLAPYLYNHTNLLHGSLSDNARDLSPTDETGYAVNVSDNRELSNDSNSELCKDSDHDITLVRYAYVAVGAIVLLIALLYVVIYCLMGHHLFRRAKPSSNASHVSIQHYDLPRCFRFGFLVLLFVFYLLNLILERIGGDYLSLFVVEGLGWSVKEGAVITAGYWGAHGLGRLFGVLVSLCVSPKLMIFASVTCTSLGYTTLLFVDFLPEEAVYAAVMLAGMGVSTVFPSMLLWVSTYLSSSNILSAVCVTGASMGTIIGYPLIGSLIEALGYMWYVYSLVASSFLLFIMLIIIHVYSQAAVRRKVQEEEINEY